MHRQKTSLLSAFFLFFALGVSASTEPEEHDLVVEKVNGKFTFADSNELKIRTKSLCAAFYHTHFRGYEEPILSSNEYIKQVYIKDKQKLFSVHLSEDVLRRLTICLKEDAEKYLEAYEVTCGQRDPDVVREERKKKHADHTFPAFLKNTIWNSGRIAYLGTQACTVGELQSGDPFRITWDGLSIMALYLENGVAVWKIRKNVLFMEVSGLLEIVKQAARNDEKPDANIVLEKLLEYPPTQSPIFRKG